MFMADTPIAPVASTLSWGAAVPPVNPQIASVPATPLSFGQEVAPVDAPAPSPMEQLSMGTKAAVDDVSAQKQADVAQTAEEKKAALAMNYLTNPNGIIPDVLAAQLGSNQQSEMSKDFSSMSMIELEKKYGIEVAHNAWRHGATKSSVEDLQNQSRDTGTAIKDTATNVFGGAVTGVLGVDALLSNLGGADFSARAVRGQKIINEGIKNWSSELSLQRDALGNITDQITTADNQAIRDKEIADGATPLEAGMKYVARNLYSEASNIISDPIRLADLSANSIGNLASSLLTTGGLLKASGIAANSQAAKYIYAGVEAAMEGGDAFSQTNGAITGMSFNDLEKGSETYRKYLEAGKTPDEARNAVAQDAGLLAAAVVAPVALVLSKGSAKFEMSILTGLEDKSIKGALAETGKAAVAQFTEEAAQEGNSQFVSNALVKALADPNQDLAQGVGESAAQGGLGGLAMAGFTNATHIPSALHGEAKARLTGLVDDLATKAKEKNNPASPARTQEAVKVASEAAPIINDFVATADVSKFPDGKDLAAKPEFADKPGVAQFNSKNVVSAIQRLTTIDPDTAKDMPAELQALITKEDGTLYSKPEALYRMAVAIRSNKLTGSAKSFAQLYFEKETIRAEDGLANGLDDYVDATGNTELKAAMNTVFDAFQKMKNSTAGQQNSQSITENKIEPVKTVTITDENVSSPEVKSSVEHTVMMAEQNPLGLDTAHAESILNQYKKGNFQNIAPERIQALESGAKVAKIIQSSQEARAKAQAEAMANSAISPRQIYDNPATANSGDVRKSIAEGVHPVNQMSGIIPYQNQIAAAVERGDVAQAKDLLTLVRGFAKGMILKHQAFQKSGETGVGEKYSHQTPQGWFSKTNPKNTKVMRLHAHNPNSVLFLKNVAIDAEGVTTFYNDMIRIYPELSAGHTFLSLDQELKDQSPEMDLVDGSQQEAVVKKTQDKKATAKAKRLEKRTQKELADPMMNRAATELGDQGTLSAMPREMATKVRQMMRAVQAEIGIDVMGLVQKFMIISAENGTMASVFYDVGETNEMALVVSEDLLDPKTELPPFAETPEQYLAAVLAHEMGHVVDYNHLNKTGELASANETLSANGAVFEEVQAEINNAEDDTVKALLHNSESYEKGTEEYRKELFADLAMMLFSTPTMMKELIPNAAEFVQSIVDGSFNSRSVREKARKQAKADRRSVRQNVLESAKAAKLQEPSQALKDLYRQLREAVKFPLLKMIIGTKGVDPEGPLGMELKAAGFSTKTNPGLFKLGGWKDIDNLPAEDFPDLLGVIPSEGDYLDLRALTDALVSELNGQNLSIPNNPSKAEITSQILEIEKAQQDESSDNTSQESTGTGEASSTGNVAETTSSEQSTGEAIPVKPKPGVVKRTLAERFSSLVQWLGRNRFLEGYKNAEDRSRLSGFVNPIQDIREWLGLTDSGELIAKLKELGFKEAILNSISVAEVNAIKGMLSLADNISLKMDEHLNIGLNAKKTGLIERGPKKGQPYKSESLIEALKNGHDITRFKKARIVSLIIPQKDDQGNVVSYKYDPQVVQTAAIAVTQWMVDARFTPDTTLELEDLAGIFRVDEELIDSTLETTMRQALQSGINPQNSVREIAVMIESMLGVLPEESALSSDAGGILLALANEALSSALAPHGNSKTQFVTLERVQFQVPTDTGFAPREYTWINFKTPVMERGREAMRKLPSFFAMLADPEVNTVRIIGAPPKNVNPLQLRNKTAELSRLEKRAVKASQDIGYSVNQPMLAFMEHLGRDNYLSLLRSTFGGVFTPDLVEGRYNKNDYESRKGNNVGFLMGWENSMAYVADMNAYADATGMSLKEVKAYWAYRITKVGRPMMDGFGPQNDKTARELLTATNSVIDLNDQAQMDTFWMTIGQSIGLKTEKMYRADTVAKAKQILDPTTEIGAKYFPMIEAMEDVAAFMKAAGDKKFTDKELHAMVAISVMLAAKKGGDTSFEHRLAFEADGKTDGPINSLINATVGGFSNAQLAFMAMGGAFFRGARRSDGKGRTLNDYWQSSTASDLYLFGANDLQKNMETSFKDRLGTPSEKQMRSVMRLLGLTGNVTFDAGKGLITIQRNALKNPLTISVYGSGLKGISNKVTNEILNTYYELMSDLQQARIAQGNSNLMLGDIYPQHKGLEDDFYQLMNNKTFYLQTAKKEITASPLIRGTKQKRPPVNFDYTDASKTTVPPAGFVTLSENMQYFFTAPMKASINEIMGGTILTMDMLMKASNLQSQAAMAFYESRKKALIEKKTAAGEMQAGDYLPRKDLLSLVQEANNIGPLIETNDQTFNLGVKEAGGSDNNMVEALTGPITSGLNEPVPSEAGAKFAPFFNIGTGDGLMNLILYGRNTSAMDESLGVYDGIEMAAHNMDRQSAVINKSVSEGWGENNIQFAVNSFRNFVRNFDPSVFNTREIERILNPMSDEQFEEYVKSQEYQALVDEHAVERFREMALNMLTELQEIANQVEARKRTMKDVTHSVDHMAGAEQAYLHEGIDLEFGKEADQMNVLYDRHLENVRAERAATTPNVLQVESGAFKEDILKFGQRVVKSIVSMPISTLSMIMKNHVKDKDEKQIMTQAAKALVDAGFTFVYGTETELTAYRDEKFGYQDQGIKNALIDNINKVIYVSNITTTTLLHEMIHAATVNIIQQVLDDPDSADKEAVDAVDRMVTLMNQFMENIIVTDVSTEFRDVYALRDKLINIMADTRMTDTERMVTAMSEFMAYSLTNQNLKSYNKGVRIRDAIVQISRKTIILMKRLLGIHANVGNDVYSNIKFNTQILMVHNAKANVSSTVSLNEEVLGPDARISRLYKAFNDKLAGFRQKGFVEDTGYLFAASKAINNANTFSNVVYNWNAAQINTFAAIQATMATTLKLDNASLLAAQEIYLHALKHLKEGDVFITDRTDPNQKVRADAKFNLITGAYGSVIDKQDRSNLLSSFLALSQVDEEFRKILEAMPSMKTKAKLDSSFEGTVSNLYNATVETLTSLIFKGHDKNAIITKNLDALALSLSVIEADSSKRLDLLVQGKIDKGSDYAAGLFQKGYDKTFEAAEELGRTTKSKLVKGAAVAVATTAAVFSNKYSGDLADKITGELNKEKSSKMLRSLVNEIRGMTTDNATIVKMIGTVKYAVSSARQDFRENVPNLIASKFSKRLKNAEWSRLFRSVGKSDVSSLVQAGFTTKQIGQIFADQSVMDNEIAKAENELLKLSRVNGQTYINKAKQLALYMMTGDIKSINLNTNATSIAMLLGEKNVLASAPSEKLVKQIDILTTLYAMEWVDQADRTFTSDILKNEHDGMEFMLNYMSSRSVAEKEKGRQNNTALYNHYKGRLDTNIHDEGSLIVTDISYAAKLSVFSYKIVGSYKTQQFDTRQLAYFYSPVSGTATFNQGVMQTVRPQMHGVDLENGLTMNGHTAGVIGKKRALRIHNDVLLAPSTTASKADTYLIPRFEDDGGIGAYERPMARDVVEKYVKREENLAAILGAWRGRQAEEELSQQFNEALANAIHKIWQDALNDPDPKNRQQFTNVAQSIDPTVEDAFDKMPAKMKEYITHLFGENTFMIRRDMVDDAIGYRMPSIGDAFTGKTTMPAALMENIQKLALATPFLGDQAYARLVQAESIIQTVVSVAKLTIVVKSGVVMIGNLVSNIYHLSVLRGVPISDWGPKAIAKVMETNRFLKNKVRKSQIEAELAATNNVQKIATLKSEYKSLDDSDRRMSIWPLIEAGEFNTISDGLTEADQALSSNKWVEYIENKFDNLPEGARTVVKNALVTRDTSLFKLLNRGVQYGDFIAKSIYYDHLKERKGKSHDEILSVLKDEFVDYNRLPGRVRTYAESIGLTWFFAFKLRALKVSMAVIRDNPLKALWATVMPMHIPMIGSVDTVLNSNAGAALFNGKLSYSLGPQMAQQMLGLNPFWNITH